MARYVTTWLKLFAIVCPWSDTEIVPRNSLPLSFFGTLKSQSATFEPPLPLETNARVLSMSLVAPAHALQAIVPSLPTVSPVSDRRATRASAQSLPALLRSAAQRRRSRTQ